MEFKTRNKRLEMLNTALPEEISTGMRAVNVQTYTESNVKLGLQFTVSFEATIAQDDTAYYSFETPASPTIAIKQRLITTGGGIRYTPRAGATFTPENAPLTVTNLNGNSENTSGVVVNPVLPVNVTDEGVAFDVVRSATGVGSRDEQGIFVGDGIERILAPSSSILLKFENLDNNAVWVTFSATWYEGDLDLQPIV